ncbi:MAG: hypothetical protein KU37_07915 [Sulfuricurvum sp. PC08-66]|nr:MAG: hypothetical protein KU37_07915 [Sulfuricurvum sp. PC08-66]
MRKLPSFLLLLLLFPLLTWGAIIESMSFKGLVHLSNEVAIETIGLDAGDWLDEEQLDVGIKKLFEQGYFKDIAVYNEAGNITIVCIEKPIISHISVKGFKESDSDEQLTVLGLKKGQIFDQRSVDEAKKRILRELEKEGAIDSIVEVESEVLENGSISLTFLVNKGKKITITQLLLEGVNGLDRDKVYASIANKAEEFLGWIPGRSNGELKLPELKIDPMRLRDTYMQNGYLDAKVDTPLLRVNFNSYTAELAYRVEEGMQYSVDKVSFLGHEGIVDTQEVNKSIKLKSDEVFNIGLLREDMQAIQTLIANEGYAYAQVRPDLQKDPNGTVNVVYDIVAGEKVYIRDVIITGNTRTLDRVIRREVFLAPGDLYNMTDLKDSKSALGRTGYFKESTIEEKRVSANEMDLVVHVQEAPTGNIQVGGGYGTYGGLSFDASLSDRNIFGSGLNLALKLQGSQYQSEYSIGLTNPRIFDSTYSGSVNLYIRRFQLVDNYNTDTPVTQYVSNQAGATLSVGKRFTRTISGNVAYRYIDTAFTDYNSSLYTAEQTQPYEKSSLSASMTFNDTDDYYVPREGWNITNAIEVAGIGGSAKFVKDSLSVATYVGLNDWLKYDAVLRYKGNFRVIKDLGFVPLDEHFFMGGLGTVRGYLAFSLPAYDSSTSVRTFYATKMISNTLELSLPLLESARLRWALFIDYGYIGRDSFTQEGRGGYGAQLEWFSPMGPIALIFAQAFDNKVGDSLNGFEFSIGRAF